ncbi:hypothetical protein RR48_07175 [Papilio machaon]|uniref:Uncharacterized protein n=1 Tax=Papilio machaon TaxID=76193 RepID=A0A194RNU6_PAPMA|nr:hypothetical protein RR48_07175 [Papilio machaon]
MGPREMGPRQMGPRCLGLRAGPTRLWAWLAVLAALGRTTAYTDTEEFLSDLDKPGFAASVRAPRQPHHQPAVERGQTERALHRFGTL